MVHLRKKEVEPWPPVSWASANFATTLSSYLLESETPVAITRHGETAGYYYPARERPTAEQLRERRVAGERLQVALDEKGLAEDELVKDFQDLRANSRAAQC